MAGPGSGTPAARRAALGGAGERGPDHGPQLLLDLRQHRGPADRAELVPVDPERLGHGQVHLGGHLPEPRRLVGEVPPASAGSSGRPEEYRSRNEVSASAQPSVPPARNCWTNARSVAVLPPHRLRPGHVGEAHRGQRLGHHDVGIGPVLQPAEDLGDEAVVEHQRRVGLLHVTGRTRSAVRAPSVITPSQARASSGSTRGVVVVAVAHRPQDRRLVALQELGRARRWAAPRSATGSGPSPRAAAGASAASAVLGVHEAAPGVHRTTMAQSSRWAPPAVTASSRRRARGPTPLGYLVPLYQRWRPRYSGIRARTPSGRPARWRAAHWSTSWNQ